MTSQHSSQILSRFLFLFFVLWLNAPRSIALSHVAIVNVTLPPLTPRREPVVAQVAAARVSC